MIKLITAFDVRVLVNKIGIQKFLLQLIEVLKNDYSRWHDFIKSPRHAINYQDGIIELMPISNAEFYSFKYVSGHPKNPNLNKQTVVAFGCLADVATGYPLILSEMTLLTALRTAAVTALASEYLANKKVSSLGIIGTGAISEFLVLAHWAKIDIKNIKYFDIDHNAMEKFAKNLEPFHLELQRCDNAKTVVKNADVIITATAKKQRANVLNYDWIKPGAHVAALGGDCPGKTELDPKIVEHSKIVVEYLEQSLIEGEVQNFPNVNVYAELWELITNKKKGRESDEEMTLFDSVGFALEDFSALKLVYQLSEKYQIGQDVELIPSLKHPKDLFRFLNLSLY